MSQTNSQEFKNSLAIIFLAVSSMMVSIGSCVDAYRCRSIEKRLDHIEQQQKNIPQKAGPQEIDR